MFERYTEKARRVIFFARYEASQFGASYIETEHLLLGLLREDKALADRFLGSHAEIESIRKQVEAHTPAREKVSTSVDMPLSHECKRILAYGSEEAERIGHSHIGTEHMLLGLLREEKSYAAVLLRERGLILGAVREELAQDRDADGNFLQFAHDLTQAAAEGNVKPTAVWDPLVNRLIEILWRRSKNSPVLIGEDAGAKSAVVERLAFRIAKHEVPEFFYHKRIFALDVSRFAAERKRPFGSHSPFRMVMKELIGNLNEIVFFAGQLEAVFGSTGNSSGVDVLLRPALYVERAQCICAATPAEYHTWIENDPLLRPHFEPVEVPASDQSTSSL
jgi:ATP-dependent Clp protease ATP-binding subunit ClpC